MGQIDIDYFLGHYLGAEKCERFVQSWTPILGIPCLFFLSIWQKEFSPFSVVTLMDDKSIEPSMNQDISLEEWSFKLDLITRVVTMNRESLFRSFRHFPHSFYCLTSCGREVIIANELANLIKDVIIELSMSHIIVVNVEKKELLRVDDVDLKEVIHNEIIDLNVEGDRWEGDVLCNKPFGWGVLYDKDNNKRYEGFRIGEMDVCYGRKYYADIGRIEYEGELCEGKRWGRGVQYDRNGMVVFDGRWLNNERLMGRTVVTPEWEFFHNHTEELVIVDGCFDREDRWIVLDLQIMPKLRSLEIGNHCFKYTQELRIVGLKSLERVVIGDGSFTKRENHLDYDVDCQFHLKDCPKLRELKIGAKSFVSFTECEINNVDALEVIEIGTIEKESWNFYWASFQLQSAERGKVL